MLEIKKIDVEYKESRLGKSIWLNDWNVKNGWEFLLKVIEGYGTEAGFSKWI